MNAKKIILLFVIQLKVFNLNLVFYWNFSSQFFSPGNNKEVCGFALPEIGL
jgi:hypothetical protein